MQIKISNYASNMNTFKNLSLNSKGRFTNPRTENQFGQSCKLTISCEGKKLSEQFAKPKVQRSMQAAKIERMQIREQKQQESYKDEYSSLLESVNSMIRSVQEHSTSAADTDTIQKKQEALREMVELKEKQDEENDRRIKEAESAFALYSKQQEEIDQKNKDLLLLFKSLEDEEEEDGTSHKTKHDDSNSDGQSSIGEKIGQSASEVKVSAARRELQTLNAIQTLENDGLALIADVKDIIHDINTDLANAKDAFEDDNLSEEERSSIAIEYAKMAKEKITSQYAEMIQMKSKGLQEKRDANELKTKHIKINPLDGLSRVQQNIMDTATDLMLHEETQGVLDEASQELEDMVQEEIEKKNHTTQDSKEQQESEDILLEKIEEEKTEQKEIEEKEIEMQQTEDENKKMDNKNI